MKFLDKFILAIKFLMFPPMSYTSSQIINEQTEVPQNVTGATSR